MAIEPGPSAESLVGPTEDEWRAMSPAERDRRVMEIIDTLQDPQRATPGFERHRVLRSAPSAVGGRRGWQLVARQAPVCWLLVTFQVNVEGPLV